MLIAFEPVEGLAPFDAYFGLIEELEGIFGRHVDLMTDRPIRNPYLKAAIERQRVRVWP